MNIVVKGPAGSGKTTLVAQHVATSNCGLVEIYAPTHELAHGWYDLIKKANPAKRVRVVRGRSFLVAVGQPLCVRHTAADQLSKWGVPVYPNLCYNENTGDRCPHYDRCDYITQFGLGEVVIYTHAHLTLDRSRLEQSRPDLVIIDESFFLACVETVRLPVSVLTNKPSLPPSVCYLFSDILASLKLGQPLLPLVKAAQKQPGGLGGMLDLLAASQPTSMPTTSDKVLLSQKGDKGRFSKAKRMLAHIKQAVKTHPAPQSVYFDDKTQELVCSIKKPITRFNVPAGQNEPDLYILDANASRPIIEQFFRVDQFLDAQLPRNARVIQCHSTRCSTHRMDPARQTTPKGKIQAEKIIADIQALIDRKSAGGQKVLVVGPSAVTGNVAKGVSALLTVPAHCELAHFNAIRGIDRWKDNDIVIIVGRNQPPVKSVEDIAAAVFMHSPTPLATNGTGRLPTTKRGYQMRAGASGVDVEVHPDPRTQEILEQLRECESTQAIDRLRLIHNVSPKEVIILSNIVLDIDVDEVLTWDQIIHGNLVEQTLAATGLVVSLAPAWLAAAHPTLWKSAGAAKKYLQRLAKERHSSNSTSIGKMSPFGTTATSNQMPYMLFKYKPTWQRSWSCCAALTGNLAVVKAELEKLLGVTVSVKVEPPK